jgi:thiamine biosynthesis lipoprotein
LELFRLLQECTELSQASEGAFEITLGELVELWNIDQWAVGEPEQEKPAFSQEEILRVRDLCGYYRMKLESKEEYRIFLPEGMSLDLGAVGKGYALDRMRTILEEEEEITGAILSVGGNVLTYGRKPDGSSWKVGIVNPFEISSNIGVLSLEGQWCVSTSGDYERYVEVEGVRHGVSCPQRRAKRHNPV